MKVIIIFYTVEPKPVEHYDLSETDQLTNYNSRIIALTKSKAKFVVYIVGECVGDYS